MFRIPFAYEVAPERRAELTLERTGAGSYLVTDHWRSRYESERRLPPT